MVASALPSLSLFFVFQFCAIFGVESYPPPVNVSAIYTYDSGPWEENGIPLINMRDYLELLNF